MKTLLSLTLVIFLFISANANNYYWVNGSGNWSDFTNHWAISSGGSVFHVQAPTPNDDVYFDANSFITVNDSIILNSTIINCRSFEINSTGNIPSFVNGGGFTTNTIKIFGSFVIISNVYWQFGGGFEFKSNSPGNVFNSSGSLYLHNIYSYPYFNFSGTGEWLLQNDLMLDSNYYPANNAYINIDNGTFITNNHNIFCGTIYVNNSGFIKLGTSHIICEQWTCYGSSNPQADADSALIESHSTFHGGTGNVYNDVITHDLDFSTLCTFHDVTASYFIPNRCTFHNVLLNDSIISTVSSYNSTYNKLVFQSPASSYNGKSIFDSMLFDYPGMTITLSDTITVNSFMSITSDPGFPTSLSGGTVNYNGTLCSDFLYIQNSKVTGQFYAGAHSVDLGGNSGWIFSSCTPTISNVWPGDANYDLIVDNIDLLYIGIAYGDTGFVRPGATNSYVAQPCQDWFYQFQNTTNLKKADSDGNGIIDAADTVAVSLNYGLTHPFKIVHNNEVNTIGADLFLQMPPGQAIPGTNINIPIILGTTMNPALDVYGIAFTINFDQSMIQPGSMNIDFSNSWIDPGNNHLSLARDFSTAGKFDLAFTRIDGNNISGNGVIGNISFTVANNAMGFMHFTITNIKSLSFNENDIPVVAHSDSVFTNIDEKEGHQLSIFPNPTNGKTNIFFNNPSHENCRIDFYNSTGQIIYSNSTRNDNIEINGKDFKKGLYYLIVSGELVNLYKGKIVFY